MDIEEVILDVLRSGSAQRLRGELWVVANRRLQRSISVDEWRSAIESLQARGLVTVSAGAGDRVALAGAHGLSAHGAEPASSPVDEGPPNTFPLEGQLMPALGVWLESRFIPSLGDHAQAVSQNTAYRGPRRGAWSQPDYTIASVRRYKYSNIREVDLFGFELKRAGAVTVVAVHEALAHTRWVHHSSLVFHLPDPGMSDLDTIKHECARHGIGLIVFEKPDALDTWKMHTEPEKRSVDPLSVDRFVDERFEEESKAKLRQWLTSS
ncbi:MAG: hypothetical protein HXY28_09185 [Hydrogenophilaceae bacterium]|nr:hypothetical protein [Hydrogenophilaceae bacterium]